MRQYCLGFRYDHDGVVLIRKSKPAWQAGLYNGIGGTIQANEAPVDAMCREFHEETGILTAWHEWDHIGILRGHGWVMHVYSSYGGHNGLIPECDEGRVEVCKDLPVNMEQSAGWLVRYALDHSVSQTTFEGHQRTVLPAQFSPLPSNIDMQSGARLT